MSNKKPPGPAENQSPDPIAEAPHEDGGDGSNRKWIAAGAAVGVGSAAIAAALLYARSKGKRDKA